MDVLGELHWVRCGGTVYRTGTPHLSKAREINVAEHAADVWMSDETILRIDQLGASLLAHFHL